MAYTPINWQNGDTITAEKMNKMDNGWSVSSGTTTLCNETVTTELDGDHNVAYLSISDQITAETLDVTFAGTKYTCARNGDSYGDSDGAFSTYPFRLYDDGTLYTASSGTYAVKVEAIEVSVEISASFAKAVVNAVPIMKMTEGVTTWQEVNDALASGIIVFVSLAETGQNITVYNYGYVVSTAYDDGIDQYTADALFVYKQSTLVTQYSANSVDDVLYPSF